MITLGLLTGTAIVAAELGPIPLLGVQAQPGGLARLTGAAGAVAGGRTGMAATVIALVLSLAAVAAPHVVLAIGLAFVIAPPG